MARSGLRRRPRARQLGLRLGLGFVGVTDVEGGRLYRAETKLAEGVRTARRGKSPARIGLRVRITHGVRELGKGKARARKKERAEERRGILGRGRGAGARRGTETTAQAWLELASIGVGQKRKEGEGRR